MNNTLIDPANIVLPIVFFVNNGGYSLQKIPFHFYIGVYAKLNRRVTVPQTEIEFIGNYKLSFTNSKTFNITLA